MKNLPVDAEAMYVHAVHGLECVLPEGLQQWSMCAGTGIMHHCCQSISAVLEARYHVRLPVQVTLVAEMNDRKRKHLKDELRPGFVVAKLEELRATRAVNEAAPGGPQMQDLPPCNMVDSGIPCVSRSTLNTRGAGQHQDMVHCVQDGRGKTGEAARAILDVIDYHPDISILTLECVKGLLKKQPHQVSDAEFIVMELQKKGWWAYFDLLDASAYGSPEVERLRAWWAGGKDLQGSHEEITAFFRQWLKLFQIRQPSSVFDCLTLDDAKRQQEIHAMGVHLSGPCSHDPPCERACASIKIGRFAIRIFVGPRQTHSWYRDTMILQFREV